MTETLSSSWRWKPRPLGAELPLPGESLPKNEADPKETRAEGRVGAGTQMSLNSIHPPNFPVTQANNVLLYETAEMGLKTKGF